MEKFGVPPDKVVDVQALAGDSTDNVPGVPGIGVKTAAELIKEYGDLDTLLARAGEIKQPKRREKLIEFAEQARISRELVRLKDDVPIRACRSSASACTIRSPTALLGFLREMEFNTLTRRIAEALGTEPPALAEAAAGASARRQGAQGAAGPRHSRELARRGRDAGRRRRSTQRTPPRRPSTAPSTRRSRRSSVSRRGSPTRYAAGRVAFDTGDDRPRPACAPSSSASRWPSRRARPATCRSPIAGAAGELDFGGGGAAAAAAARGARAAEAAARGPVGPEDRPEHQVRLSTCLPQHGIHIAPFDDTMLMSYVLDGGAAATAWTISPSATSATPASRFDQVIAHAPRQASRSARSRRCRSTRRRSTRPRTPTSRCGCGWC